MVWIADRKKSEVLALFAVGLAYYTSIITRVGYFTLYSNLVLTAAAVFFLVRNRWAALSLASLVATYAAYAFWRFFNGSEWHWASPERRPVDRHLFPDQLLAGLHRGGLPVQAREVLPERTARGSSR